MKKELDVAAAFIKQDEKILLCQRKKDDHYPNLWEFPGGCVESGESLSDAIEREIKEELGLVVKAERLIGQFFDEDENLKIKVFLFSCRIKAGKIEAIDCQNFGFFDLIQTESLDLAPVDKKIFRQIKDSVFKNRLL